MRSHIISFLAIAACCGAVHAQTATIPELGEVAEVRGLVTMSLGSTVATVVPDTPIFDGARFVTSSSGGAMLKFKNGCTIELKQNEWIQIDSTKDCSSLLASVKSTVGPAAAGDSLFARSALPLIGAAALAGAVIKLPNPEITPRPR